MTIIKAVKICKEFYQVSKELDFFPALTGGTLYKGGFRKDIDIAFYSKRQEYPCKWELIKNLHNKLHNKLEFVYIYDRWLVKARWWDKDKYPVLNNLGLPNNNGDFVNIDIFFPEDEKSRFDLPKYFEVMKERIETPIIDEVERLTGATFCEWSEYDD